MPEPIITLGVVAFVFTAGRNLFAEYRRGRKTTRG